MNDTFGMDEANSLHDRIHEILDLPCCHCSFVSLNHIHQVLAAILHDKVQSGEILWISWSHDLLKFHNLQ